MFQSSHAPHMVFHWPCVAAATLLDDSTLLDEQGEPTLPSLREEASWQGLCYLRVLRCVAHDLYQVEVAATYDLLQDDPLTIFVSEADLGYALAYDCRVQNQCAHVIRTRSHAHAAAVRPLVPCEPEESTPLHPAPVMPLEVMEEPIAVTTMEVEQALRPLTQRRQTQRLGTAHVQHALLSLAIEVLEGHLQQVRNAAHALVLNAHIATLAQLQRWQRATRQRVVNIARGYDPIGERPAWQLTIGVPQECAPLAA